ncbi:MAG TPA: FHA domain-containing protein [Planctomycetes bacterium]|nr:FHA domain-containing protein [Planctomycetota bacterium]
MAELILPDGKRVPLQGPLTIGSAEDADLRLPGYDLADYHCAVRPLKGGGFGLKDLGSEGGTLVDGKRIQALRLRPGAKIRLGKALLRFEDATASPSAPGTQAARQDKTGKTTPRPKRDSADLPVGTELAGYRILGVCGHGGMGTVYRALQVSLGREVALKVLRRDLCEDPGFVDSFLSEARAAARFNHPNVVSVFDVGIAQGRPFYSMELLDQGSLEDILRKEGKLPVPEAIRAIRDAARGLAYAEQLGLVHRDIKPENLMRTQDGRSKICDLGLAGNPADVLAGKVAGTPHFMSPEQIRREPLDHRSDLYSLGVTFYRLLTGKTPFTGKNVKEILKAHLESEVPSVRTLCPEAPEELDEVLRKLLAKNPDERFQSASELLEALDKFSKEGARSKGLLILLALLVVGLGGGITYLLTREPKVRVQTIKEKDPKAAALAKKNFELEAMNAWHQIPKDLEETQRIAKLQALISKYKGTPAAHRAEKEIPLLQRRLQQKEQEAAAAARKRNLLLRRFQTEPKALLAKGDYRGAMKTAKDLAQQIGGSSRTKGALQTLAAQVEQAWQADINRRITALRKDAEKADLSRLQELRTQVEKAKRSLLRPIPGLKGGAEKGKAFAALEAWLKARSRAEAVKHQSILKAQRDQVLFGKDGILQALRDGQVERAATLSRNPGNEELKPLLAPVLPLVRLAEKAATKEERSFVQKAADLLLKARPWIQSRKEADLQPKIQIPVFPLLPPRLNRDPTVRQLELGLERLRTLLYALQNGAEVQALKAAEELQTYHSKDLLGISLGLGK